MLRDLSACSKAENSDCCPTGMRHGLAIPPFSNVGTSKGPDGSGQRAGSRAGVM